MNFRIKMDPNRNPTECCRNDKDDAHIAYNDYHRLIETNFKQNFIVNGPYNQGLLIDIHGQSHPEEWIELGYTIPVRELDKEYLNSSVQSSLNVLASKSSFDLEELIRGSIASLGGIMEKNTVLRWYHLQKIQPQEKEIIIMEDI